VFAPVHSALRHDAIPLNQKTHELGSNPRQPDLFHYGAGGIDHRAEATDGKP